MFFGVFPKVTRRKTLQEKVAFGERGLYLYLLFPITVAFLLTFSTARIINYIFPDIFLVVNGVHMHHFAWGIIVLVVSGYLALVHSGPRAKYFISLFYGFGLGLSLDEAGMWLQFRDDEAVRWSYDGLMMFLGLMFLVVSAKPGIRTLKALFRRFPPDGF